MVFQAAYACLLRQPENGDSFMLATSQKRFMQRLRGNHFPRRQVAALLRQYHISIGLAHAEDAVGILLAGGRGLPCAVAVLADDGALNIGASCGFFHVAG